MEACMVRNENPYIRVFFRFYALCSSSTASWSRAMTAGVRGCVRRKRRSSMIDRSTMDRWNDGQRSCVACVDPTTARSYFRRASPSPSPSSGRQIYPTVQLCFACLAHALPSRRTSAIANAFLRSVRLVFAGQCKAFNAAAALRIDRRRDGWQAIPSRVERDQMRAERASP